MKFFFILISCLSASITFGGGYWSIEHRMIDDVGKSFNLYRTLSNGVLPTSWSQIFIDEDYWASRTRTLLANGLGPIQAMYVFTPTNLTVIGYGRTGQVLIARSRPLKEDGRMGRYVIYNNPADDLLGIRSDWISEEEFQKMLAQSGVNLPEPNREEVHAAKAAVEALIAKERREHDMIIAAAPKPTWAEIRAAWGDRIKSWFVVPAGSGASSGGLRMLPLTLVGLSLAGSGVWLFRKSRR